MHTIRKRYAFVTLAATLVVCGCGHRVATGVTLNALGVVRTTVSNEPPVGRPEFDPRHPSHFLTVKHADIVGDITTDRVSLMPGEKGLEIQDGASGGTTAYKTDEYITDFGTIASNQGARNALVVFTYPNPEGGGSFRVLTMPEQKLHVEWKEPRGVAAFETVTFRGRPVVAYLRSEHLIVRNAEGMVLKDAVIQGASTFGRVWISDLDGGRLAVLASGDGYTQQHMVAVLDEADRLQYQEIRDSLAYQLAVSGSGFDVWAVNGHDRYTLPAAEAKP